MTRLSFAVALLVGQVALAEPILPEVSLLGTDGASYAVRKAFTDAPFTVVTFFARHCPVQRAHDLRLTKLATQYQERGIRFFAVDSESGVNLGESQTEARERSYLFPILVDKGGVLARALNARFATFTVVFDANGQVRYQGGIDADKLRIRPESPFFLKDALDALLSGKEPPKNETKALGCSLRFD